jgi:hypothetical protein
VNSDCTAAFTFYLPTVSTVQGRQKMIIHNNGREMRSFTTVGPLGPSAFIEFFERVSRDASGRPGCRNGVVRGAYVYSSESDVFLAGQFAPVASATLGLLAVGPGGAVTGSATTTLAGQVTEGDAVNASVAVNPDCTGALTWGFQARGAAAPHSGQNVDRFVVLNNGDDIVGVTAQSVLGRATGLVKLKRISMATTTPAF